MTATYIHVNVLFWVFFLSIICYMYMYMFIWFYIDRLLSVLFKTNVKTNMLEPVQRYRLSVRHELILSKGTLWFPQRNCFQTVNFTGNIILRYRGNSRQTSWREVRRVIDLYPPSSVCPSPPPPRAATCLSTAAWWLSHVVRMKSKAIKRSRGLFEHLFFCLNTSGQMTTALLTNNFQGRHSIGP